MKNKFSQIGGSVVYLKSIITRSKQAPVNFIKQLVSSNGLIITLIIGIFINFASNQLQNMVDRQKYYELLELELVSHMLQINNIVEEFGKSGRVSNPKLYQTEVFRSGLNNGNLLSLKPDMLSRITTYYAHYIEFSNLHDGNSINSIKNYESNWYDCVFTLDDENAKEKTPTCEKLKKELEGVDKGRSDQIFKTAVLINESNSQILNEFKPTQERLKSPILRLLMGSEALGIMK